ncbi:MAG TPA: hypothetical protein VI006_03930, partial [Solirubrobacteraceae bacterium]
AVWLPVYLVGMGLIVYLSDFGPRAHPWFPLWWDMLAVAVFSLAIFFWAMRVALPTHKIEQLVTRGAASEEPQRSGKPPDRAARRGDVLTRNRPGHLASRAGGAGWGSPERGG